jgi:hypothetical protein
VDGRADEPIQCLTGLEVEELVFRVKDEESLPLQRSCHALADLVQQVGDVVWCRRAHRR